MHALRLSRIALISCALSLPLASQTTVDLTGFVTPNTEDYDTTGNNHTFTISSGSATQSGDISGSGTVTKTGAGTIAFTGTNTYTGGTTVSGGSLFVNDDTKLGAGTGALAVNSGATLSTGAHFFSNRNITFDGVGTHFTNGNGELAIGYNGTGYLGLTNSATAETYNLTFGYTGGGGTVDISSGATLTANANIYISAPSFLNVNSGGTAIAGAIANSGTVNLNTGGTLATSGLSGNGAFNLAGGTLRANTGFTSASNITLSNSSTVNSNGYGPTLSGILSGDGALTKSGSGTLTLSGANTYSGTTTVSGGTLSIAADSGLGTAPGSPTAGHLTLDGGALATTATFTLDANRGIALGSSGGTLDTAASTALSYGGIIAGSGTLTKSGDGTLALAGANTYTGATAVNAGTVVLSHTTNSPSFAIASGATLELHVDTGTRDGDTTTFTGSGTLAKTGAGTAVWGVGAAAFELGSGAVIDVQGGVLSGGSSANEVWINNLSDLNVASGATFTGVESNVRVDAVTGAGTITTGYNGAGYTALTIGVDDGSGTFSGVIANTDGTHIGNLVKVGSGTQTLTGANTYTGTTTVNAGTLSLGHASNTLADTGTVSIAGGTLALGTNSDTVGTVNLASGAITGSGPLTASTFNLTDSGTISANLAGAASLTKSGAGTVTVDGTINLSGTNGTAGAAGTDAVPTPDGDGGWLDGGTATHGGSGGAGSAAGSVVVNAGTLTFDASNLGLAGGSGGSGGNGGGEGPQFGQAGDGGQGGSGGAGGAFTLNSGTVTLGSTSSLNLAGGQGGNGGDAGAPGASDGNGGNGGNGGSLSLAGGDLTLASGTISLSGGNGGAPGNNDGAASPGNGGAAGDFALSDGSFTMNGGALNLTGGTTSDESYGSAGNGGDVTITGGTFNWNGGTIDLRSGSAEELATDGTFSLSGGTLVSTASQMDGANNLHGGFAFNSGTLQLTDSTVTFNDGDGAFQDAFAEDGSPAELGNRQLVIDHTFEIAADFAVNTSDTLTADSIHVASGTFKISAENAVSTGTSLSLANTAGAVAEIEANQTFAALSGGGSSGGNIALSNAVLTVGDDTSTTFAGAISGDGALTKAGSGTLTLSGSSSYSGNTTVSEGTLAVGSNTALGASAASVSSGATLDLDDHSITVTGLQGAGSVDLGSGNLTVANSFEDNTFSGTLAGTGGALSKSDTATLTLTGDNTYTGATTISDGTLQIGNGGGTGSIASATVTNNGTLTFNRSNAIAFAGDIGGSGVVNQSGSDTLTLSGDNSYTGATNVAAGTLVLASDTALGTTASGTTVESSSTLAFTNNISVGAEAIANDGTVDNLSGTNSYAGALSGSGNLTVTGGQLTLSGDNSSFSGSTAINGGTLTLGSANALGSTSVDVANGAALDLNDHSVTIADLDTAGTGAIDFGSATLTTGDADDHAFTGIISGTGALTKQGTGNLTLSGANTYEGGTTVTTGTLTGTTSSLQGDIANEAAVVFDQATTGTYAGVLSGTGSLTKSGNGNVTLSGNNSYSGTTTVSSGTLTLASDTALGTTAAGTTVESGATLAFTNNITVGAEAIANEGTVENLSGTNSYAGALSGSGDLSVTAGQLTLSGTNVHTGSTTVASGSTLSLQAANTLSSSSALTLGTTGALVLNDNNQTVGYLAGDGTIDLGGAHLTVGAHDATSTYIGNISGVGGSLEKIGSGTFSMADTNSFTGGTTITAGNLIGNTYSLQGDILNNATLTVSQNISGTLASDISGTGALVASGSGVITLSGTNSYTGGTTVSFGTQLRGTTDSLQGDINNGWVVYFQQSADGTYSSILSGTGIVGTLGTGTVTLAGNNTYTGATEIAYGTLRLGSANALGSTSSIYVYSDGTFDLNGYNATAPSFGGSGSTLLGSGTLTVGNADNHEYSGVISESGNLVKNGSGTLSLTGINTYTGRTTINDGTIAIVADSGLGAAPSSPTSDQLTLNGGALRASANLTLDANRGIYLDSSGGTLASDSTLIINGQISGSGNLALGGEGFITLNTANTFTGNTSIDSDLTVTLGHSDALQNSTVTKTGSIRFGSLTSATIGAISGAEEWHSLNLQNATSQAVALSVGGNGATTTFGGTVSGSGSLTVTGGDLTLTGANTHSGTTTLTGGSLTLGNELALQNSTLVANGGSLYTSGSSDFTLGGLAGSGNLDLPSSGTLTVGGNDANTSYSGDLNTSSSTFVKTGSGDFAFSGGFNDSSSTVRLDEGTFTLGNASGLYDVTVDLNGGTLSFGALTSTTLGNLTGSGDLALANADSTPAAVALTVGSNSNNATYDGVMSGAGSLTKSGSGTFTLSDEQTFTGDTTVTGGTLELTSSASLTGGLTLDGGDVSLGSTTGLQNSTVTLNNGDVNYNGVSAVTFGGLAGSDDIDLPSTSLTVGGNDASTSFSGYIQGSGTLIKAGDGNLTFSGEIYDSAAVQLDAGTFTLGDSDALRRSAVTLNGGALSFGTLTSASLNGLNGSADLALTNAAETPAAVALTIGSEGDSSTYSGVLSGDGSLTKAGSGTFTLSGANTFTGDTTISDGTLALGATGSLAGDVNLGYGTLSLANASGLQDSTVNLNGGDLTYNSVNAVTFGGIAGSNTLELPSTSLTVGTNDANTSFSGSIRGSSSFIKAGDGNLTFSGQFDDNAAVRLDAGTFTLGSSYGLERNTVTLNGGALSFGNLTSATIDGLSGSSDLALTNAAGTPAAVALTVGYISGSSTYTGVLSGAGSLTKTGSGTFTLEKANTFTGTTTIDDGTLALGSTGSLTGDVALDSGNLDIGNTTGLAASTVTANGGNLTYNGVSEVTLGGLAGSNSLTLPTTSLTVGTNHEDTTYSGELNGSAAFIKDGTGTLTLNGSYQLDGSATIAAGTLKLGNSSALDSTTPIDIASGATLDLNNHSVTFDDLDGAGNIALGSATLTTGDADTHTLSGVLSGTGSLVTTGSGTLNLRGVNTYTGNTTVADSTTLSLNQGGNVTQSGNLTINNGALDVTDSGTFTALGTATFNSESTPFATSLTVRNGATFDVTGDTTLNQSSAINLSNGGTFDSAGNVTVNDNATLTATTGASLEIDGQLSLNDNAGFTSADGVNTMAGSFIASGANSLQLSAGARLISAGNATFSGTSSLNAVSNAGLTAQADLILADGATNNVTLNLAQGSSSVTADLLIGQAGTASLSVSNGALTVGGAIVLGSAADSSGSLSVSAGSLLVGGTDGISRGDGAASVSFNNATLNVTGSDLTTSVDLATSGSVTVQTNALNATLSGDIGGTGGIIKTGTGSLTLSGSNTYAGATLANAGTLSVAADSALGTAPGSPTAGQLTLDGGSLATTASFALDANRGIELGSSGGTIETADATTLTYAGIIDGDGALTKTGTGSLTLTGQSTYTGNTTIAGGTLTLDHASDALVTTTDVTITNGGTLNTGTYSDRFDEVFLVDGTITAPAEGSFLVANAFNVQSGSITTTIDDVSGTGTLTKTTSGTVTLTQAAQYNGATDIQAGTFVVTGTDASINNTSALTIGDADNATVTVSDGGLIYTNALTLGDTSTGIGTLNITAPAGISTVASSGDAIIGNEGAGHVAISGGGSLGSGADLKLAAGSNGTATVTVSGNDGNSSPSFIAALGSLVVAEGTDSTATLTVSDGALARVDGGMVIGAGSNSSGTVTITGANSILTIASFEDPTVLTVALGTGSGSTGNLNLLDGATTVLADTESTHGLTGGPGSANVTINNATLATVAGGTLTSNVALTTAGTATFATDTGTMNLSGAISGSGAVTKTGTGSLSLSGTNSYEGATTVAEGTLTLASDAALGATSAGTTVASGATLAFTNNLSVGAEAIANSGTVTNVSGDNTYAGVLSGTGNLAVTGGSLTLAGGSYAVDGDSLVITGDNTYTGATTIASGATLAFAGPFDLTSTEDPYNVLFGLFENGAPERSLTTSGIVNQGTLALNGVGYLANGSAITGGGDLTVSGVSAAVLQANGNQLGDVTVGSAAAMLMAGNSTLTSLEVNNGLFAAEGGTSSINGSVDLGNDGTNGRGILEIYGAGTSLDITGDIVNHGTAQVRVNGGQLSVTGNVNFAGATNQADFEVSNGGSATIGGNLVLNGTLTSQGENVSPLGTMVASVRENASLRVDGAIQLGLDAGTSGNLNIEGTLQVGGTNGIITGAGETEVNLGNGTLQVIGSDLTTAADIHFSWNPSSGTATVDTNGFNATLSGTLDGNGSLTKTGSGTLSLSGANTYEGGTTVSAGTLHLANLTGSATGTGDVMIADGAALTGTGSIGGNLNVAGLLAPGNSPGIVTVDGNLVLNSSAIIAMELAGTGGTPGTDFDQIVASGSITLAGTLNLSGYGGYTPMVGDEFQLFQSPTSIGGSFAAINFTGFNGNVTFDTAGLSSGRLSIASVSAVPEPATAAALLGLVTLGFAATRRRRRA